MPPSTTPLGENYTLEDLRVSIIGNEDLKLKLAGDDAFMATLVSKYTNDIDLLPKVIEGGDSEIASLLITLENEAIVLKILCYFITETSALGQQRAVKSIQCLQPLVNPIVSLLSYYTSRAFLRYNSQKESSFAHHIENTVVYGLDILILLCLSGSISRKVPAKTWNTLARFVVFLTIASDSINGTSHDNGAEEVNDPNDLSGYSHGASHRGLGDASAATSDSSRDSLNRLLVKSLKTVPFLLENSTLDDPLTLSLLNVLLKRLSTECTKICRTHFPDSYRSEDRLREIAFGGTTLPTVDPVEWLLRAAVDVALLHSMLTAVSQVLSFFKFNDYDIMLPPIKSRAPHRATPFMALHTNVYVASLLLLKYPSKGIRLVSLNLICAYLGSMRVTNGDDSWKVTEELIFRNYRKLFPRIIDLLVSQNDTMSFNLPVYLLSPTRIMANICTRYPLLNDDIYRSNLDGKLLRALEFSFGNSALIKSLRSLKRESRNGAQLVEPLSIQGIANYDQNISDILLLLSVYISSNEDYRQRVTASLDSKSTSNLVLEQIIFEILDDYRFLVGQLQLVHHRVKTKKPAQHSQSLSSTFGTFVALLNNSIFTNCLYLIRSVSRSVPTLRTFFVECNSLITDTLGNEGPRPVKGFSGAFIRNILSILRTSETTIKLFDYAEKYATSNMHLRKSQVTNTSLILGVIANLILAFSSFRYEIINDTGFLQDLSQIYQNFASIDKTSHDNNELYQCNMIQLNVLHVLKNFIFNENNETKKEVNEAIPLSLLFDRSCYGVEGKVTDSSDVKTLKIQQKVVSFDIFRNYTASSQGFNELISSYFDNKVAAARGWAQTWEEFLVMNIKQLSLFSDGMRSTSVRSSGRGDGRGTGRDDDFYDDTVLLSYILVDEYVNLVTSINYIENHKFINIGTIDKKDFPSEGMFMIWLRFLQLQVPYKFEKKLDVNSKVTLFNNLHEIKTSIMWIIINLSHHDDTVEFSAHDSYSLFDTVGENDNIDIDDSDDSDSDSARDDTATATATATAVSGDAAEVYTVSDRASLLRKLGFSTAISALIDQLSRTAYRSPSKGADVRRFDLENSYDLLERAKEARMQLLRSKRPTSREPTSRERDRPSDSRSDRRPGDPGIAYVGPSPLQRPDVNRGGEGYGYGSDDDYAHPEDQSFQSPPPDTEEMFVGGDDDDLWVQ